MPARPGRLTLHARRDGSGKAGGSVVRRKEQKNKSTGLKGVKISATLVFTSAVGNSSATDYGPQTVDGIPFLTCFLVSEPFPTVNDFRLSLHASLAIGTILWPVLQEV